MDSNQFEKLTETLVKQIQGINVSSNELFIDLKNEIKSIKTDLLDVKELISHHTIDDAQQFGETRLEIQSLKQDIAPFQWTLGEIVKALIAWIVPASIIYLIFKVK